MSKWTTSSWFWNMEIHRLLGLKNKILLKQSGLQKNMHILSICNESFFTAVQHLRSFLEQCLSSFTDFLLWNYSRNHKWSLLSHEQRKSDSLRETCVKENWLVIGLSTGFGSDVHVCTCVCVCLRDQRWERQSVRKYVKEGNPQTHMYISQFQCVSLNTAWIRPQTDAFIFLPACPLTPSFFVLFDMGVQWKWSVCHQTL